MPVDCLQLPFLIQVIPDRRRGLYAFLAPAVELCSWSKILMTCHLAPPLEYIFDYHSNIRQALTSANDE